MVDVYLGYDELMYIRTMSREHPNGFSQFPYHSNYYDHCELIPSYLSLDIDGRVLCMDSVSKVLAPGSRMGWVTASQHVNEKFIRQNNTSAQNPSGFSQVVIYKLLNHHWGHLGFFKQLEGIQAEYVWRRDTFAQAWIEFLPEDIASWKPPRAGMFVRFISSLLVSPY